MAQIFHRSTNTISRVSIFGAVFFAVALLCAAGLLNRSPYVTQEDVVREQPVPFSHEHHAGGLGIDCRFCHTSVETSRFAGLPSTETCMTCHSQVWNDSPALAPVVASFRSGQPLPWTRVTDLPDFVSFDHGIHVAKGVSCATCHGDVAEMPLTWREEAMNMEWCLRCHRDPERFIGPRSAVFQPPAEGRETARALARWLAENRDEPEATPGDGAASREGDLQAWLASEYHARSKMDCSVCHR